MSEAIARWNIELVYVDDLDAVISELRSLNIPFSEQTCKMTLCSAKLEAYDERCGRTSG